MAKKNGIYTKTHSSKKAAEGHVRNIRKRKGKAKLQQTAKGYMVTYSWEKKI